MLALLASLPRRVRPPARRGRWATVLVALAWVAVLVVGVPAAASLPGVQSDDPSSFVPTGAGSTLARQRLAEIAGARTEVGLVVLARDDGRPLGPAGLAAASVLAGELPSRTVAGLPHGSTLGDYLVAAPRPGGPPAAVPSRDGRAVVIALAFDPDLLTAPDADGRSARTVVAASVRSAVDQRLAQPALRGASAHLSGPLGLTADLVGVFADADTRLLPVALVAVALILLLVYRSPLLVVAVLATSLAGLVLASLVVRALAGAGALAVSGQARSIMAILVVGAATDYSMLLVARHREELGRQACAGAGLRRARRAVVEPVVASAVTVVAALGCLLLSASGANRSLGPVAAIGVGAALVASLTLLPLLLRAGRALYWPRVPRFVGPVGVSAARRRPGGLWAAVARLVGSAPRRTWATTAVLLAAAAAFAPTFDASGTSQADSFLSAQGSVTGLDVAREHFPAAVVEPASVVVPAGQVRAATAAASAVPGVVDVERGSADARWAELRVGLDAPADAPAAADALRSLRSALADARLDAAVGGPTAAAVDMADAGARDREVVVPAVLAAVGVLLLALLRSPVAAALLVGCNLLSFAATLGLGALVLPRVLGTAGADPLVPISVFVFLVALGVDYSIFLMTRVRAESRVLGVRPGVLEGLHATGAVITGAGVVLAATFASLTTVPLLFLTQVGSLVAFGVLLDTVVVRSLLVPALVHDLGRRAWWPAALGPAVAGPGVVDLRDRAQDPSPASTEAVPQR